ncbi:MAG: vWA domain-containing protein [Elusimicrobiota bacterium]
MKTTTALLALLFAAVPRTACAARSQVEVVFVLDTTGSMDSLIEGAKQKIWSIANGIAAGKPAPRIRMGLIAYRDKGDAYVTQSFDLTSNLDKMYENLLSLRADGGGDGPEHVLKALDDSVTRMSWSKGSRAFKVVYLVGDAPAHREYGDTPSLEKLVESAVRRGVVVNTVQCGSQADTEEQWRKIARLGEGRYLPIPQSGGMVSTPTPFDDRIAELNSRIEGTLLAYGARKEEAEGRFSLARRMSAAVSGAAAADRAAFASSAGYEGLDLIQAVQDKKVDLGALDLSSLPDPLKGLSADERRLKVEKLYSERSALKSRLAELSGKRAKYLKEHASDKRKDSFDARLMESLKEQAGKKGILY